METGGYPFPFISRMLPDDLWLQPVRDPQTARLAGMPPDRSYLFLEPDDKWATAKMLDFLSVCPPPV
jgi:hypothetical protein